MKTGCKLASNHNYPEMPSPTNDEINSKLFKCIFDVIKRWDINDPKYYSGYCSGNGSHTKLILDAVRTTLRVEKINDLLNNDKI